MQIPQYKSNRKYGFNMTPMIDVVFLLIIFFLVSSHLSRQETQMDLDLSVAVSSDEDLDLETPRIVINVKSDGSMFLTGRPIEKNQLKQTLVDARDREGEEVEVRIRSSRDAAYSHVEPIMLACTAAKIFRVTYAVYREDTQ